MTLTFLYGTRPEAIKLGPVAAELRALGVPFKVVCSGQHTSLLSGTPADTDLHPDIQLGIPGTGDLDSWVTNAHDPLNQVLSDLGTTWLVIQGDTQTAGLGAEVASELHIPIAHVEAGVRSHCLTDPYPEEGIRVRIAQLASLHCAATETARYNLRQEEIWGSAVHVTGNPVVSALARYTDASVTFPRTSQILITLHRRETITDLTFPLLVHRLRQLADGYPEYAFLWPLHPHTKQKLPNLRWPSNLLVVPPQSYRAFTRQLCSSHGVLTDSGGVTEEACSLGTPTAILRFHHDRPEAIDAAVAERFDPTPDGLTDALQWLRASHPGSPSDTFGTPDAASKIAHLLASLD